MDKSGKRNKQAHGLNPLNSSPPTGRPFTRHLTILSLCCIPIEAIKDETNFISVGLTLSHDEQRYQCLVGGWEWGLLDKHSVIRFVSEVKRILL